MKVEIIVLDMATAEALLTKYIPPTLMHYDNQVVIFKVPSRNVNEKKRHLRGT